MDTKIEQSDDIIKNDIFDMTDEESMTPKEYYDKYKGQTVSYKGMLNGNVAGYVEHYLIIGFINEIPKSNFAVVTVPLKYGVVFTILFLYKPATIVAWSV